MPNKWHAKDIIHLRITMEGVRRLWDRYLAGMKHQLVLGDELSKDMRWCAELERILLGSGYMTQDEIHKRHLMIDSRWTPETDQNSKDAGFKH